MKNITCLFVLLALMSCNKEPKVIPINNSIIQDTILNVVIRPVHPNLLTDKTDSLKLYYEKLNFHEIWYADENRKDLIKEIKFCYKEGLNPDDYKIKIIEELEEKRADIEDDEIIKYDILLTETFEKLSNHLYKGKLNPKEIYSDWDLNTKEIALSNLLEKGIKEKKLQVHLMH